MRRDSNILFCLAITGFVYSACCLTICAKYRKVEINKPVPGGDSRFCVSSKYAQKKQQHFQIHQDAFEREYSMALHYS